MKTRASQLPVEMMLDRSRGPKGLRRGQMPPSGNTSAEQEAVGKAFEEMLLREMVKAMQKTVPEGSLTPDGPSKGLYEHMLQQAMVENLSGQGGMGIADALARSQNTLKRSAGAPRVRRHAAPLEAKPASFDRVEADPTHTETLDLSRELPPQDDPWIDSPLAEAHLRRLISPPSDRK